MQEISSKALAFGEPKNKEKTFQGQRFDDELGLNWVQFKWRNHDPQTGRFIEIDPLSDEYEYNSTYAFSENKVISHVELEGLEAARIFPPDPNYTKSKLEIQDVVNGYNDGLDKGLPVLVAGLLLLTPGPDELLIAGFFAKGTRIIKGVDAVVDTKKAIDKVADVEKTAVKATNLQKAEERAAKLSEKQRPGKDFTRAGKEAVKDVNKAKNKGQTTCESCGVKTTPSQQSKKGVTPSKTETQIDHIKRRSEGGSGTPNNGQVLCRGCNLEKH